MCGICGIFRTGGEDSDPVLLEKMADAMAHRGPDGSGIHHDRDVALGHRRLSIIDLEGGSQPMFNEDGSLAIIFNGEIYNFIELREELARQGHRFRTRSDTEVILHAFESWGPDCTRHFNGIFAFALWDAARGELFLARDHLGVKPLYWTWLGDSFLFASEIKALLVHPACPREVDPASLEELFTYRYVPSPWTLLKGIFKLPPAHHMTVSRGGGQRLGEYWPATPTHLEVHRERDLASRYQDLLEESVRLQLRSDVPVGLFLSSGIDSGALLAIMSGQLSTPPHTFTIGFEEGHATNELEGARELAKMFGSQHHEMMISHRDYLDYYQRYMDDIEEPVGNETAAAFFFVSKLASRQVKVAFTGQGADEPWAGYGRHLGENISATYRLIPHAIRKRLIEPTINALPRNELLKRGVVSLSEDDDRSRLRRIYSFFTDDMKSQLFRPGLHSTRSDSKPPRPTRIEAVFERSRALDPLSRILYMDVRTNLPDDLLMVGDKTAMANSIEARVPYLDVGLVEFIESIPPEYKIRGLNQKYLHKRAVEKWLPPRIVRRKKKGFAHPVDIWLRGSMQPFVREMLLSGESHSRRYFRPDFIERLIVDHSNGREDHMRHLYLLLSFELWLRKFVSR